MCRERIDGDLGEKISKNILSSIIGKDFRRPKSHCAQVQSIMNCIDGQTVLDGQITVKDKDKSHVNLEKRNNSTTKAEFLTRREKEHNDANWINQTLDKKNVRAFYAYNRSVIWGVELLTEVLGKLKDINGAKISNIEEELLAKEVCRLTVFQLTRAVWVNFADNESEAMRNNALIFSWFNAKFGISADDVEAYAKAAGTNEEVKIFGKNVAKIFGDGVIDIFEIFELSALAVSKLEILLKIVSDAFNLPIEKVEGFLKK